MKKIILLSLTFLATVGSIQSKTASNSLPEGSYQKSCKNCKYNNNTQMLTCACLGSNGYNYSTITVTSDTIITNSNGTLTNGLVSSGEDADDDDTDE